MRCNSSRLIAAAAADSRFSRTICGLSRLIAAAAASRALICGLLRLVAAAAASRFPRSIASRALACAARRAWAEPLRRRAAASRGETGDSDSMRAAGLRRGDARAREARDSDIEREAAAAGVDRRRHGWPAPARRARSVRKSECACGRVCVRVRVTGARGRRAVGRSAVPTPGAAAPTSVRRSASFTGGPGR